jgi:hypothetical protein
MGEGEQDFMRLGRIAGAVFPSWRELNRVFTVAVTAV